jgi:hypothetical protein
MMARVAALALVACAPLASAAHDSMSYSYEATAPGMCSHFEGSCLPQWTDPFAVGGVAGSTGECGTTQYGCPATPCDTDTTSWCCTSEDCEFWCYCEADGTVAGSLSFTADMYIDHDGMSVAELLEEVDGETAVLEICLKEALSMALMNTTASDAVVSVSKTDKRRHAEYSFVQAYETETTDPANATEIAAAEFGATVMALVIEALSSGALQVNLDACINSTVAAIAGISVSDAHKSQDEEMALLKVNIKEAQSIELAQMGVTQGAITTNLFTPTAKPTTKRFGKRYAPTYAPTYFPTYKPTTKREGKLIPTGKPTTKRFGKATMPTGKPTTKREGKKIKKQAKKVKQANKAAGITRH